MARCLGATDGGRQGSWIKGLSCGVVALVAVGWTMPAHASKDAKQIEWAKMLAKADKLEKLKSPAARRKAADLLLKAYHMAPLKRRSLLAAAHACLLRASLAKKGNVIASWGKRGVKYAKQLVTRWPRRAEGYFWLSVNHGQHARGGGVWAAITGGLAGKIERNALKSFRRNPLLYKGAAQRILGRYYYRLPWPMRRLKKSLRYLEHAYKHFPKLASNQFYLAETLWAMGKKSRAIKLFRSCARARTANTQQAHFGIRCYKWLRKHNK